MAGSEFKTRRKAKSAKQRTTGLEFGQLVDADGKEAEVVRVGVLPATITDSETGLKYFRPNGKAYVSFDGTVLYRATEDDDETA